MRVVAKGGGRALALRHLTVKERVLLHLFEFNHFAEEYEVPVAVTQAGIARAVGVRLANMSQYVGQLVEGGLLEVRTRHVQRKPRRYKTYFLSVKGRNRALGLRRLLFEERVPVRDSDGTLSEKPIGDLLEGQRGKTSLLRVLDELASSGSVGEVPSEVSSEHVEFLQDAPGLDQFYGRAEELEVVFQNLERVPLVTVFGIAGIGKSTLGAKVCQLLSGNRSLFWRRVRPWDTALDLVLRLAAFLRSLGRPALHNYLRSPGVTHLSRVEEILRSDLPETLALLVFDDVQNAREDTLELLSLVHGVLQPRKGTAALLLSREAPRIYTKRDLIVEDTVFELPLRGLGQESSLELLADEGVPSALVSQYFEGSGGNPLFLKILARAALEGGLHGGRRTLETYVAEDVEPGLTEAERRCIETASFYEIPVRGEGLLLDGSGGRKTLDDLRRRGLLDEVPPARYVLHEAVRNSVQHELPVRRRIRLTNLVVPWLLQEGDSLEKDGVLPEAVSFTANACIIDVDPDRRASSFERLGDLRGSLGDLQGAIEAHRKARGESTEATVHARLHQKIAGSYRFQRRMEEAEREMERGLHALGPDPSLPAAQLLVSRAWLYLHLMRDYRRASRDAEKVLAWIPSLGENVRLRAAVTYLRGVIHAIDPAQKDNALARQEFEEAAGIYTSLDEMGFVAGAYLCLGLLSLKAGGVQEAGDRIDEAMALAARTGKPLDRIAALFIKAWYLAECQDDPEAARQLFEESYQIAEGMEIFDATIWHQRQIADLERGQGHFAKARAALQRFLKGSVGLVDDYRTLEALSLMVRLCAKLGDGKAGEEYLEELEALGRTMPSSWTTHCVEWGRAAFHAFHGDHEEANQSFERASLPASAEHPSPIFEEFVSTPTHRGEFLLEYGQFLTRSGNPERAVEVLLDAERTSRAEGSERLALLAEHELRAIGAPLPLVEASLTAPQSRTRVE